MRGVHQLRRQPLGGASGCSGRDFARFWEQVVRWAGKPAQSTDCEIFTDVEGQEATVRVEAFDAEGKFLQLAADRGTGPHAGDEGPAAATDADRAGPVFRPLPAPASGSYIVNLQYRKTGAEGDGDPPGQRHRDDSLRPGVSRPVRQRPAAARRSAR